MDDDEMKNLELVEALMNRASGIETKEEGDRLDRLILSGEISTEDIDEANKEVEIIRSLLPLVNEDAEAKFPEYAKERMYTKIKEVFPDRTNLKKEGSSLSGLFGFLKPVLTFSIVVALVAFIALKDTFRDDIPNFVNLYGEKAEFQLSFFDLDRVNSESNSTGLGLSSTEGLNLVTDQNFILNSNILSGVFLVPNAEILDKDKDLVEWDNVKSKTNGKKTVRILYDSLNLNIRVQIVSSSGITVKDFKFLKNQDIPIFLIHNFLDLNLK